MNTPPIHDIVVFGATGFTGRLATLKLASDPSLHLAIAGRNRKKLEDLQKECAHKPAIIDADSKDKGSITAMVRQAKVVANFAGPFALYAEPVIAACSELGRAYCDITGETPFIRDMIDRYEHVAQATGACLIPMAGFDSVPADVMSYIALEEASRHGWDVDDLKHYYRVKGGFNGGTLLSVLTMAEQKKNKHLIDSNILIPDKKWAHNPKVEFKPTFEPFLKRWSAPFLMNSINTAVVRRSIYLRNPESRDSQNIAYTERSLLSKGRSGNLAAYGVIGALGIMDVMTGNGIGRAILRKLGPSAGQGPSEKSRKEGFYRGTLIAREKARPRLTVKMKASGDPGNEFTVLCATTIAKLLVKTEKTRTVRGFQTPTSALGDPLIAALEAGGVTITTAYVDALVKF
ncbi:MAG: saccharopine dehydrogenase NADP-binding domain-containing protein [Chitinophagaceae bacterium]|nr:saccharopine dehydrogenase NADP-binding domain-containing protein [Oligoflexus sp.]